MRLGDRCTAEALKRVFLTFYEAIERKGLGNVLSAPVDLYMDMVVLFKKDSGRLTERLYVDVKELFKEVL